MNLELYRFFVAIFAESHQLPGQILLFTEVLCPVCRLSLISRQMTGEIGLGIPAEPLFRSGSPFQSRQKLSQAAAAAGSSLAAYCRMKASSLT